MTAPGAIALLDVDYRDDGARAACVVLDDLQSAAPRREWTVELPPPAPYEPGAFYQRELPCLLAALAVAAPPTLVVIDGYVYLDEAGRPGLGVHLYEALGKEIPVIGVAKTAFRGSSFAVAVTRGESLRPLYVTAVGVELAWAAAQVRGMAGPHRLPLMLQRVDHLARGQLRPQGPPP